MPPRLAAISGKLKGAVFAIDDEPLVIGRETAAHLCIADASVSRRHSKIEKHDDSFVITDLESLNGTFVNDVPVRTRVLEHGDRVRIGDSQFLFLTQEGETVSKSSDVRMDEAQVVSGSTVQIRFDHAIYLMGRDLSALMKVSTAINSIRGLDDLLEGLLKLLFEVVPAQRGAILLTNEGTFETNLVFGLHRSHGKNRAVTVSSTIAQQVLRDGVALLANDGVSEWTQASDSLVSTGAHSVMCVPLLLPDRKLGVLYLDTTLERDQFNNDHLKLVAAISSIAGGGDKNRGGVGGAENRKGARFVENKHRAKHDGGGGADAARLSLHLE